MFFREALSIFTFRKKMTWIKLSSVYAMFSPSHIRVGNPTKYHGSSLRLSGHAMRSATSSKDACLKCKIGIALHRAAHAQQKAHIFAARINSHQGFEKATRLSCWSRVLGLLKKRGGLIDGVVFSGGEPAINPGLIHAIADIRELGIEAGLHTGGAYPKRLWTVVLVDWGGIDIKARHPSINTRN